MNIILKVTVVILALVLMTLGIIAMIDLYPVIGVFEAVLGGFTIGILVTLLVIICV